MEPELVPVTIEELDKIGSSFQPDGAAKLAFKSGCIYEGQLSGGRLHGKGKLTFPDGLSYEGDFNQNTVTGQGTYRWPSGAMYMGDVFNGKRHGQGRMWFKDSPVAYEGGWRMGMRHGQGTLMFNLEGTHSYKGEWVDDMKQGKGVMQYTNGDMYEGEWLADQKHGLGKMTWKALSQSYEGQWQRNKQNGVGTHIWYQQLVSEPSPANHALLLMFNRYQGRFVDGKRNGYGTLYYATGARYEGQWVDDKKEGQGCYVFENGEVWRGAFKEDRPVLAEGEIFAPRAANISMQIDDLIEEEDVPAASARGVNNVLMVYNSDLRALYDKYCKRPSLHLLRNQPCPSFTLVSCQVWEMLSDARLITASTPLARVDEFLVLARRPPLALAEFRSQMYAAIANPSDEADRAYWASLFEEHVKGGPHQPMTELLFREFCELLVRVAAARYRALPGLERRLHTLVNAHLLHQVAKAKATSAPPRTAFHLEFWAGNAVSIMQETGPMLRQMWALLVAGSSGKSVPSPAAAVTATSDADVYGLSSSPNVRDALGLLRKLGVVHDHQSVMQAAAALVFNYLTINTYGHEAQRLRIETEPTDAASPNVSSSGAPTGGPKGEVEPQVEQEGPFRELDETDEREVLCWLDTPLLYPDFVEGLARVGDRLVQLQHQQQGNNGVEQDSSLHLRLIEFMKDPGGLLEKLQKYLAAGAEGPGAAAA